MLGGGEPVLPISSQLCVPLLRCRRTPRGSTLPPAVQTRTSPFLTSPQASVWPPCLATQVSVAPILYHWNFTLPLVFWDLSELPAPPFQTTPDLHCWNRSLAGTSGAHRPYSLFSTEIVTGMKFSNDCKHLISVSGDR